MPLVIIQTPALSPEQKKRIGDRVVESLHHEGVPAASVVVLFQTDKSDIYLDGGLVHEVTEAPAREGASWTPTPAPMVLETTPKSRRKKSDFSDLRERLVELLHTQGELSSFDAQVGLGLRDVDGTPAALRKVFNDLEAENLVEKKGQKRGTRYVWKGTVAPPVGASPILVKRTVSEEGEEK
ncbi:MAG: 4-oxalocrotonate tautomerase family protein [Firmicutes bacterium]|nr:4-oxalocrotonate tautomerase family protein [Bacillota bacterium]